MNANLNTAQVMQLAGVSHMTVYVWRQGSATRAPLPSVAGARAGSVEFKPGQLKAWAKKHGIELKADPVAVAAGTVKLKATKKAPLKPKAAKAARTKH